MTVIRHNGGWVIVLSFLAAMTLSILPLPEWARPFRPDWVALVLLYWCMALPQRVGVGTAWGIGLLMDALTTSLLGQHALGFALAVYLALRFHQQIRVFPLWQQALSVLVLLSIKQLPLLWVAGILGRPIHGLTVWLPPLMGTILWPWIFVILRDVRRRFHVT